jgi:hypothetical protein
MPRLRRHVPASRHGLRPSQSRDEGVQPCCGTCVAEEPCATRGRGCQVRRHLRQLPSDPHGGAVRGRNPGPRLEAKRETRRDPEPSEAPRRPAPSPPRADASAHSTAIDALHELWRDVPSLLHGVRPSRRHVEDWPGLTDGGQSEDRNVARRGREVRYRLHELPSGSELPPTAVARGSSSVGESGCLPSSRSRVRDPSPAHYRATAADRRRARRLRCLDVADAHIARIVRAC